MSAAVLCPSPSSPGPSARAHVPSNGGDHVAHQIGIAPVPNSIAARNDAAAHGPAVFGPAVFGLAVLGTAVFGLAQGSARIAETAL
ncbi:hypothetical protein [Phaeobacter sp.]|uniref:hypothetical protein n=1 Tax=Phaeobacter sp. TaxID=1902409 RepID=UPI0025D84906|nr:hypothetical protein [Phaeobacter sp.]